MLAATLLAHGCAPRPLLEQAIRTRGGPLGSVERLVETEAYAAFPGTWRWQTAFMAPDRYAWTIFTTGEPIHYLFDGAAVRSFVGAREVTVETSPDAPLRSHARFTAVVNLDALQLPGTSVAPLAAAELPPGTVAGLAVVFAGDGARYRLGFDDEARLVWVAGPVVLPPLERGELIATFADFRRVGRFLLPFRTTYTLAGQPLAVERALAVCPGVALDARSFRLPSALPSCEAPESTESEQRCLTRPSIER